MNDEVRKEALAAARKLLLEGGPSAVTLANVGREIDMTHANVLYHFDSAAGLQSALMASMIDDLVTALEETVAQIKVDEAAPLMVVNRVFDAFDSGGAGQLAAWIVLARDFGHLEPIRDAVSSLVTAFGEKFTGEDDVDARVRSAVLLIAMLAFGDAVIGPYLRDMLGKGDGDTRAMAAKLLPFFIFP